MPSDRIQKTAYIVWTAVGVVAFREPLSSGEVVGLVLAVAALILLARFA